MMRRTEYGNEVDNRNVRIIVANILDETDLWGIEGKEAEKQLSYIAGVQDMANAVMRAIRELGGR